MAKLNSTKKNFISYEDKNALTLNFEGGEAYTLKAKNRLIERVLGAFWNEKLFYKTGESQSQDIVQDIKEVASSDPKFILQLAAYARNVMNLRTTPQVLLVEAANINECKPYVREYTKKIVKRADELAEVISYQLSAHSKPIPNSLKKGLADAFTTFDEYQLNKYDSDKKSVSLGDVLRLISRKTDWPVSKAMYNYLVNDIVDEEALPKIAALKKLLAKESIDDEAKTLIKKSGVTWETLISKFGSQKETWELVAPNMPYMAKLRNLRNLITKNIDLEPILKEISNPERVKKSKQLPFRFQSAYAEIEDNLAKKAVSRALDISIENVSTIEGTTAVFVDLSGSMSSPLSDKSKVSYREVSSLFGAIVAKKIYNGIIIGFGTDAKVIDLNTDDTLMTLSNKINSTQVGGSTNAWLAFQKLIELDKEYDRIVLISDMQCYDSVSYGGNTSVNKKFKEYLKKYPNTKLYSIDISGYGTKQTAPSLDKNVVLLNGWSEKVIDFINYAENTDFMLEQVKNW